MSNGLLIAWIGRTDLKAAGGDPEAGQGPILQGVQAGCYDAIHLLSDFSADESNIYVKWLISQTAATIHLHSAKLSSPIDFAEIYERVVAVLESIDRRNVWLTYHLSPGTPAMSSVWILLAKTLSLVHAKFFGEITKISIRSRVIAEFPRKWQKMVCESAQRRHAGKVEFTQIVERLRTLKEQIVLNSGRPGGDGTKSWVDRAMDEHSRQPFSAIIACANPSYPDVLVAADLDESNIHFQATGQRHIMRTSAEIVSCVGLLLKASTTVKLIDPHFNPAEPRWRRMLAQIFTALASNGQTGITLEIHRADNALPANIKRFFDSHIPNMRPAKIGVQVFLHPENAMHNRFILTSAGGSLIPYRSGR